MNALVTNSSRKVLRLIRQYHCIERTELAQMMGVTHAGVSKVISGLIESGTILQAGERRSNRRGRPSQTYELAEKGAYALGLAVRAEQVQIILIDWRHQVVAEAQVPNRFLDPGQEAAAIQEVVARAAALVRGSVRPRLLGASVAVAGTYDDRTHQVVRPLGMKDADQAHTLVRGLHTRLRIPVSFVNDVDAALLAERWAIDNRPYPGHLMYLNDLLGFSILLNGQTNLSWFSTPRWLGRAQVQRDARPRDPSLAGCLATTASIASVAYQLTRPPGSPWIQYGQPDWAVAVKELARRFDSGDPEVCRLIDQAFDDLGFVVRNLCVLFNISGIILEGWTPAILARGMTVLRTALAQGAYIQPDGDSGPPPTVRTISFGQRQQVLGAAIAAIEQRLGVIALPHPHHNATDWIGERRRSPAIRIRQPLAAQAN